MKLPVFRLLVAVLSLSLAAGCACDTPVPTDGGVGGGSGGGAAGGGGGGGGGAGGGTGGGAGSLTVTTTSLPSGVEGVAYTTSLSASGGTQPYAWTVTTGALPAGLSLASDGTLAGTPTASGTFTFTVQVSDASSPALTGSASLGLVVAAPLALDATPPPSGAVGAAYTATFLATGGTTPYAFSTTPADLPPGLTLSSAGTLSGTPTTVGSYTFTVTVTDASAPAQTDSGAFTVAINGAGVLTVSTTSLPSGIVGTAYSTSLAATNGTPPYGWTLSSGTLPAGLTLASNGTLSGTPTAAGSPSLTFLVTDASLPTAQTATATLTLTVVDALAITTTTLPAGAQASAYSATVQATGGTTPYAWSIASGNLPGGVTLNATSGALSGTPTQSGTFSFVVQVADNGGQTATAALSLAIAPLLSITTTALPSGVVGTAYSQTLAAAGGTTPYAWAVTSGTLPAGLTLSTAGVLSGTPTATGVSNFTVGVTDASTPAQVVSATFALPINGAGVLTISTATVPTGVEGAPYSTSLAATGGTTPYTWSVLSGSLPAGLSLSSAGVISGTPTTAGSSTVTIQVIDTSVPQQTATVSLTLVVAAPLVVTTSTLPGGITGTAYSATLAASGGTSPFTWALTGGALPAGLTLSASGAITGSPTASGTFTITVTATDSGTPAQTASATLNLTVIPALVITTGSLPNGVSGTPYSTTMAASGGTPAYSWSRTGGAFPTGLSINAAGVISGTPTQTGSFTVQLTVTDAGTPAQSQVASFTFFINGAGTLTVTTGSLPVAIANTAYSATLAATGGTTPYTWSIVAGALPPGLSLNASTGVISGTPTSTGSYAFTAQVRDSSVPTAQTATGLLQINVLSQLLVTTASLPSGVQAVFYNTSLAATGGTTPYTWSISAGALPAGLNLNAVTGVINGFPTTAGTYNFTVRVQDSGTPQQVATRALSIVIAPPLAITTTSPLSPGVINVAYSRTLAATGGNTPYTWSISGGSLPAGLTLSSAGVISGTPTATGTSNFMARVQDSSTPVQSVIRLFSLTISPALQITTATLPGGTVAVAYSATLTGTGGNPAYTWSVTSGALPPGLSLNASTGALTGTPTTSGPYNFTIQLADSTSPAVTVTRALSILVSPAGTLTVTTTSLPDAVRTVAYPATSLTATGGTAPYTWLVTAGALPPGLTLSGAGVISGTPTVNGAYAFTVQATDAVAATASRALSITVRAPLAISSGPTLPVAVIGRAYNVALTATGGLAPYAWSISAGTLPSGLSMSATGVITGTPTGPTGPVSFTARVTDSAAPAQVATRVLTINVDTAMTITTASVTAGRVGVAYSFTFAASGGTTPYSWSGFLLPPGLTVSAAGVLSGTPTTIGSYNLWILVTDAYGQNAWRMYTMIIGP